MGKYWAIYVMSWVLRVLAVLTIILPILWVIGLWSNPSLLAHPQFDVVGESQFSIKTGLYW